MSAMFAKPELVAADPEAFAAVEQALRQAFSPAGVAGFLRRVKGAGLRVRDFESILAQGLLGPGARERYGALGDQDRGMIRERYLHLLEQVPPELRRKFLAVYAYY